MKLQVTAKAYLQTAVILLFAQIALLEHLAQHNVTALLAALRIAAGGEVRRVLTHAHKGGGLGD